MSLLTIITRQFLWPWSWNHESSHWLARWNRTKRAYNPAFWRKQMKKQFNTHLTMQIISLSFPLLQRKTKELSSCPLCIPKKIETRIMEKRKRIILQPENRLCGHSRSSVQHVHHGKKNKPLPNEALLWNNWQSCIKLISYVHWKCAQLWWT